MRERLSAGALGAVAGIEEHDQMKVAVANVTDDRRDESARFDVGLGFKNAIGKTRNRHTGISGQAHRTRSESERGVIGRVAGFPQPLSVLRLRRPLIGAAAELVADCLHRLGLLAYRIGRAVKLEEQSWLHGKAFEFGIADA